MAFLAILILVPHRLLLQTSRWGMLSWRRTNLGLHQIYTSSHSSRCKGHSRSLAIRDHRVAEYSLCYLSHIHSSANTRKMGMAISASCLVNPPAFVCSYASW